MTTELIRTVFTYLIALVVIVGGGALLIIPTRLTASELLPFLTGVIGVVIGYVFGERTASAASNMAQPTVTMHPGPPPSVTVNPNEPDAP